MCIPTLNTGQLNPLFHTFAEFRLIVNRIVARQSTDWLAANAQFSPNEQDGSDQEAISEISISNFYVISSVRLFCSTNYIIRTQRGKLEITIFCSKM